MANYRNPTTAIQLGHKIDSNFAVRPSPWFPASFVSSSRNYVVSVREGVSPKNYSLHRPYFIKKPKLPILRRHSLWTTPNQCLQKTPFNMISDSGQKNWRRDSSCWSFYSTICFSFSDTGLNCGAKFQRHTNSKAPSMNILVVKKKGTKSYFIVKFMTHKRKITWRKMSEIKIMLG